jgi:hypothetical protein
MNGSNIGLPVPVSRDLPSLGHLAQFLAEFFPGLPETFKGVLRISTASPAGVSVVGLRGRYNERAEFLMSTTSPVPETQFSADNALVLPHLADGGGYTTEFILFRGSGLRPSPESLQLFQQSGAPFILTMSTVR